MLQSEVFYRQLTEHGVSFFTGVPDSLLKDFLSFLADSVPPESNIIAANEGNAIALAVGYYLATGGIGMVYMQNSGLGNAVNPLTSLADPEVYSIPMLILVGWRGEPGVKDEPQHRKQGRITTGLLETLEVPYQILPEEEADAGRAIERAVRSMLDRSAPHVLLVRKGTFAAHQPQAGLGETAQMSREEAIRVIVGMLPEDAVVVSTTGKASRELYELREKAKQGHGRDFLTVGSMGHSSQIALGIALTLPERPVFCLDGDGAVIMHAGGLAIIGSLGPANFKHIVLNNCAHDSVGGQPTCGFDIDIPGIAAASGYSKTFRVSTPDEMKEKTGRLIDCRGPALLEVRIRKGARTDLGRPLTTPIQNKQAFMQILGRRK
ncbi:MAG: phosphonopyruvate decarboxylase [candidate division WOR-3 bacterium]|nr:MAG: phosphonopyruvate decarboxylase [candidate division WOR-3 bacterium]